MTALRACAMNMSPAVTAGMFLMFTGIAGYAAANEAINQCRSEDLSALIDVLNSAMNA